MLVRIVTTTNNYELKGAAVRSLAHLNDTGAEQLRRHPDAIPALITCLYVPSYSAPAADALGVIGSQAVGPLIKELQRTRRDKFSDSERRYDIAITKALGKIGCDRRAVDPLIDTLTWHCRTGLERWNQHDSGREVFIDALGTAKDRRAWPILMACLLHGTRTDRVAAARALALLGDNRWEARVRGDDGDLPRAAEAGEGLVVEDLLIELAGVQAIRCLGKEAPTGPRPFDAQQTGPRHHPRRPGVIEALGRCGDRRVVPALVDWAKRFVAHERSGWAHRDEVKKHNEMVTRYGGSLRPLHYSQEECAAAFSRHITEAISALQTLGDPRAADWLVWCVRASVPRGLGLSVEFPWVKDGDEGRRWAALAAEALCHLGNTDETVKQLLDWLRGVGELSDILARLPGDSLLRREIKRGRRKGD